MFEKQPAERLKISHGRCQSQLLDRGTVICLMNRKLYLAGLIAVDRCYDVNVSAVRSKSFDIDTDRKSFNLFRGVRDYLHGS